MMGAGFIIGSLIWTALISVSTPEVTWLVVAVAVGFGQYLAILLPSIEPGQTLESIAT
ncbi:MAG: hypothetical protein PF501_15230 [Salinisphaera sp.]|jgi:hypothetical protein|nr:hypothetical protein [Salinisphaera sp.]